MTSRIAMTGKVVDRARRGDGRVGTTRHRPVDTVASSRPVAGRCSREAADMAHRRTTAFTVAVIERVGLAAAIGGAFVASGALVAAVYRPAPAAAPVLSVLAATLVAFAAGPTRRFLRRVVHRVVYGGPASPAELVGQLSARVTRGRDPVELLGEVARLIRTGTGASSVVIWIRFDGAWMAAAGAP